MNKYHLIIIASLFNLSTMANAETLIKMIALHQSSTCIIDAQNKLFCWGKNSRKLESKSSPEDKPTAINIFPQTVKVFLDSIYSCAISIDGSAKCWGMVPNKLGSTHGQNKNTVKSINTPSPVKDMSIGWDLGCFLTINGEVWCWGKLSSKSGYDDPVKMTLPLKAEQISTETSEACALLSDGSVWCWGGMWQESPTKLLEVNEPVQQIINGHWRLDDTLCAVTREKKFKCWFQNRAIKDRTFQPIEGLEDLLIVAHNKFYGCAIINNGKVKCWGQSIPHGHGILGQGSEITASKSALSVEGVQGAVSLILEDDIACALLKDGKVKCWGAGFKILGNNHNTFQLPYELKL